MDIAEFLKNFTDGKNAQTIARLFDFLRENSFDIKKILGAITPETLLSAFKYFDTFGKATPSGNPAAFANGVAPVANVADKEIVYALNRYLNSDDYSF